MNKPLTIAFLVVGIMLIIFGLNALHAPASDVSRFFTGSPTDKSIWMLTGGVVAAILGFYGLIRAGK